MDADPEQPQIPTRITLHEMLVAYLTERRNEIDTTRHGYTAALFLRHVEGIRPAESIGWQLIHGFRDALLEERGDTDKVRRGINIELRNLRTIFRWAYRHELIGSVPFDRVAMLPAAVSLPPTITRAQERAFYRALPRGRMRLAWKILHYTGMRRSEVSGLSWEDVDLERGFIVLARTKNRDAALVPIHPHLVRILQKVRATGPVVGCRADSLTTAFRRALDKAGLHHIKSPVHVMRHTMGARIMEHDLSDAGERMAQEILRHKTRSMTKHYTRIAKDALRDRFGAVKL